MTQQSSEIALFLRRSLAHPGRVGAIAPSSSSLARVVASHAVRSPDEVIVELGSGTGTVTRGLLDAGIPQERLILVELDRQLREYLQQRFPKATVIAGDAMQPQAILPPQLAGRIDTVVSGIPMLRLSIAEQRAFIGTWFSMLAEGGRVLQYTYSPASPLRRRALGIEGQRVGVALANLPPAHVWAYTPPASVVAQAAE